MNSPADIWAMVLKLMEADMTAITISTWFDDTTAVAFEGDKLVLCSPSDFKRDLIVQRYVPAVQKALHELFSTDFQVEVVDADEAARYKDDSRPTGFLKGTEDYTFERFVVGSSNRFAYLAAKKVAENPGGSYNPLFLYSESGLGKTHLMYAIAHVIHKNHPSWRIMYIKSEDFVNELVQKLRSQDNFMQAFRDKYRNVDVFLMDDVQFIAGKNASEEELFHTFNTLYEAKKQIVFTSDRPPKEMLRLEDRLQTRFEWGLPVDIQPPDYETRVAIIKNNAIRQGVDLPDPVLSYVAENITSNVRLIEGTVTKLLAMKDLMGAEVDVSAAIRAVRDMLKDKSQFLPSAEVIINEVANFFEMDPETIKGQGQTKDLAQARNVAMYLIRTMTEISLQEIGQKFNNRHYSTVISSVNRVKSTMKNDPEMAEIIKDITAAVNGKYE
ncbi:MAG: chromosomal replication initiator protein DnaA [Oscillospiraceae bacterium]